MDAVRPREHLISILNDDDSPSFAVRPKHFLIANYRSPSSSSYLSSSSKQERSRRCRLGRSNSSKLPVTPTPLTSPLPSLDSTSCKSSSTTMDSPSPKTPVYNYDPQLFTQYEALSRSNASGQISSPSNVTPLMDSMILVATPQDHMLSYKSRPTGGAMPSTYSSLPISATETQPLPHVSLAAKSDHHLRPANSGGNISSKKSKYPCPYAASHHCSATFTTSGHAARHGKKHTGEKGVHCPVCNKAFTRKDNMKQHERTHKGPASVGHSDDMTPQRSKAAITKDAARGKRATSDSQPPPANAAVIHSPLSEAVAIDPGVIGTPSHGGEQNRYSEAAIIGNAEPGQPVSVYPPLGDDHPFSSLSQLDRTAGSNLSNAEPPVQRTFSDLDTLALAAAYDPYSQGNLR